MAYKKHNYYDKFDSLLVEGYTIKKASDFTGIPYASARRRAIKIGWNIKWRKKPIRDSTNSKIKISHGEILSRYDNGECQSSIARDAGCSRERIRQIIKQNGKISALEKRRRNREKRAPFIAAHASLVIVLKSYIRKLRKEQINKRKKDRDEYFKIANEMYQNGYELSEIAKYYKIKMGSLNWEIGHLRMRRGWFLPLRNRGGLRLEIAMKKAYDKHLGYWTKVESHWPCSSRKVSLILGISKKKAKWIIGKSRYRYGFFPRYK